MSNTILIVLVFIITAIIFSIILYHREAILALVAVVIATLMNTNVNNDALYNDKQSYKPDVILGGNMCNDPDKPLTKAVNINTHHIICDGNNMLHNAAQVLNKPIANNADKACILKIIAECLLRRFPDSPGIHIVTKNQNICEFLLSPFENTNEYQTALKNLKTFAHNEAIRMMNEDQSKYKKLYDKIYNANKDKYITSVANAREQFYREQWARDQLALIKRKAQNYYHELINISRQLPSKVYIHLVEELNIAEKYKYPHHYEARDDASVILMANHHNDLFNLPEMKETCILSMDHFILDDVKDMHEVPPFNYIQINKGESHTYKKMDYRGFKFLDELNAVKPRHYGYSIKQRSGPKDKNPEFYETAVIKQRSDNPRAPVNCLYIGLDYIPPPQKALLPPSMNFSAAIRPDPNILNAIKNKHT